MQIPAIFANKGYGLGFRRIVLEAKTHLCAYEQKTIHALLLFKIWRAGWSPLFWGSADGRQIETAEDLLELIDLDEGIRLGFLDHLHRVFDLIGREDDFDDELILAAEGANAFHDRRPMREVRDDEIAQIRIVGDDLEFHLFVADVDLIHDEHHDEEIDEGEKHFAPSDVRGDIVEHG